MPRGVPKNKANYTEDQTTTPGAMAQKGTLNRAARGTTAPRMARKGDTGLGGNDVLSFLHKNSIDYSVTGGDIVIHRGRK